MLEFNHVTKVYDGTVPSVNDISFRIEDGEFVFLIGPSGSGKTTLIKMLIRDEVPSTGRVYLNDTDITKISRKKVYKLRREIGVIFQDYKLVQDKTAYENVAFAMEAAGKKNKEIQETVPYVLDVVGLANRMTAFPRQLSGGEQQRVAIARAIANNPKILIADEPTGNLDPASAWDIVQVLTKINNWGTTVLMSTHGTDIVNSLNKRVIQMEGGRIVRDDNKGQYEITTKKNFEEQMVKKSEDNLKHSPSKRKSLKVKIPKQVDETLEEVETPVKKGFFSNMFRFGKKPKEERANINDILIKPKKDESVEEETLKIERPLMSHHEEDIEVKEPAVVEEVTTEVAEVVEETVEVEVPTQEQEVTHDISNLHIDLKEDAKEESELKVNDFSSFKDKIDSKAETSINELKLAKKLRKDLKNAGYDYIEEIIEEGPESLLNESNLNPDDVVKIAKEIKRYIHAKK